MESDSTSEPKFTVTTFTVYGTRRQRAYWWFMNKRREIGRKVGNWIAGDDICDF